MVSSYVAFVTGVRCKTIGWSISSALKTDMTPLQGLNTATWVVSDDLTGVVRHSDRGSNDISLVCADRIVELGWTQPEGSRTKSCDIAMAESGSSCSEPS